MSILSDRQITALCVLPEKRLDEDMYAIASMQPQITPAILYADPREGARIAEERRRQLRESCMIDVTPEEREAFRPMIEPFESGLIREVFNSVTKPMGSIDGVLQMVTIPTNPYKIISRGLSSFGYDIALREDVRVFTNINSTVIDPKNFDASCLTEVAVKWDENGHGRYAILPPNSYMLGWSKEYFRIPRDVTGVFIGKSTYARVGCIINCTPAEAGWEGHLVVELGNLTNSPMRIYVDEGIAQALFFQGSEECETSYDDRGGKYQRQTGLTLAKV
jgi:dCTP deaminase